MKKRYHKTVEFSGPKYKDASGVDAAIEEVLKDISAQHGPVQLLDFKVFSAETNYVPPRHAAYLTVIAEATDQ